MNHRDTESTDGAIEERERWGCPGPSFDEMMLPAKEIDWGYCEFCGHIAEITQDVNGKDVCVCTRCRKKPNLGEPKYGLCRARGNKQWIDE